MAGPSTKKRADALPARPTGDVDPRSTGRGLGGIPSAPQDPAAGGGQDPPPQPGSASPFATYAPSSGEMQAEAERRREDSLGVMAIVGGLTFMVGSAVVVLLAVLLAFLFMTLRPKEGAVAADDGDLAGVLDTAVAEVGPARGGGGGGGNQNAPIEDPLASGPQPGPATLIIPPDALYHSIEINCPGGFRGRGKFRRGKATVYNVPPDERCVVTFQGSNYVKDWISGHQTKMCTQFEPVPICKLR